MVFVAAVLMMLVALFRSAAPQRNDEQQKERHVHHGIEWRTGDGRGRAVNGEPRPQAGPHDLASQHLFTAVELGDNQPLHDAPSHQHATENGAQNPRFRWSDILLAIKGQKHQINQPKRWYVQRRPGGQSREQAKANDNSGCGFQRGDGGCNGHVWVTFMFVIKMKVKLWLHENNYFRGKCNVAKLAL
jgi:hypothetical protein